MVKPCRDWTDQMGLGTGVQDCPQETSTVASSPQRYPSNVASPVHWVERVELELHTEDSNRQPLVAAVCPSTCLKALGLHKQSPQ